MQTDAENGEKGLSGPKLILILEDDPAHGWLLQHLIQHETPYYVLLASNGVEALKLVRSLVPHLILLDYTLPGMNGLQVYEQIQAEPGLEQVPAILVTAWPDRTEGRGSHLYCIGKPYDPYALLEVLHQQLGDEEEP